MFNLEHSDGSVPDDKLAALVRAIAWELLQLGYRPALKPGQIVLRGTDPDGYAEMWKAINEILAGGEV